MEKRAAVEDGGDAEGCSMICPRCHEEAVQEEICAECTTRMVRCASCGFTTTQLEYHAWQDLHARRPYRHITVFHKGNGLFNLTELSRNLRELWHAIRTPILIIAFMVMLTIIIVVARR